MVIMPEFGFQIPRTDIILGKSRVLVEKFRARIFCGADLHGTKVPCASAQRTRGENS